MSNKNQEDDGYEIQAVTNSYCAFLDILGYSAQITTLLNDPEKYLKKNHLINKLLEAFEASGVSPNNDVCFDGIVTRCFSDSIIITSEKENLSRARNIEKLIMYVSLLAQNLAKKGIYLRGGIAEGKSCERSGGNYSFIASEALIKAYQMESEEARFPTILIEKSIAQELRSHMKNFLFIYNNNYHLNIAYFICNPMSSDSRTQITSILQDISRKINQNQDNHNVKEKYEWLFSLYYWNAKIRLANTGINWDDFPLPRYPEFDFIKVK